MMMTSNEATVYGLFMVILGFIVGWAVQHKLSRKVPAPLADTKYRRAQAFLDACTFSMLTRASVDLTQYGIGKVIINAVYLEDLSGYNFSLTTAGGRSYLVRIT